MVKVISDSACDLGKELTDKYDIDIIPYHILMDGKEYEDDVDVTVDDIFAWSDANNTTPGTSAPSIDKVEELYKKYKDDEIVVFTISSEMSTSYNVMKLAAEELGMEDKVFVIDSRNLSTGMGLLVIEAAIMAKNGLDGATIYDNIKKLVPNVRASFILDKLQYLHRGGRCSGVSAFVGTALSIHPRIEVAGGVMLAKKKYIGKLKKVIFNYTKDMKDAMLNSHKDRVFVTHSGCTDEEVETARAFVESLGHFDEIIVNKAHGVISSHCGPSSLGVLFIENE